MQDLALKFLGDLEIVRGGAAVPLPPSRKTRALLAYIALNSRSFRREHLCELLWDLPDDPRGSLRWSLSKLRRLVDDESRQRIVADRLSVRFDDAGVRIDVKELAALANAGLDGVATEALEGAASRYRGTFLEGLDLPNFHEFQAWCVAERERATQAQAGVLAALIRRLAEAPERAVPHARALAALTPYDEAARATLIRLLMASGRPDEAEQHYRLGTRLLKEIGTDPSDALYRAWRGSPGAPPRPRAAAPDPRPPSPEPAAAASHPRPPGHTSVLVGRDGELGRLRGLFEALVHDGRGRMLLISGEPGIGKSSLLQAAAEHARAAGTFVLEACAFESEAIRPFGLWIDALRQVASDTAAGIFGAERDNRERLFSGLSDLVARESEARPVVLIFDDLQWADESSAAALHYVARSNAERPFLGILAARDGELDDNAAARRAVRELQHAGLLEELRLTPLPQAAVAELIERHVPGSASGELGKASGGNPLLALELARAALAGEAGGSLEDLVRERLARLDASGAEVLRWAAVLAPRIDVARLMHLTGLDAGAVGAALDTAERQSILRASEHGLQFSHDLVMRGVYAEISPSRRRLMHRRVAELLEAAAALDLERASDLAHHASLSGDSALAARALVSAGRLCLRFYANEQASTLARKGLEWAAELPSAERVRLTLELTEILLTAAAPEDWRAAAAECVALAEEALDHGALAHARLGYYLASHLRWMHGHWAGAHEEILQSERVARGGSEAEHIVGMAEAAKCLAMLERDLSQADAMLMEAQSLASRSRLSHHALPAARGMLRYHEGQLEEAAELFREARTLAKSAGDRINEFQANEYLAMIDFERGRFEQARAHCAALLEIGARLREGSEAPFARALDALCGYALEDDPGALDAALEELRIVDAKHRLAYVLTRAALLDAERGRPSDARARAGEALEYAEVLDRPTETMLANAALAWAHGALSDEAAAKRHADAVAGLERAPVAQWARSRAASLAARPRAPAVRPSRP